jgi:hypothetical protein
VRRPGGDQELDMRQQLGVAGVENTEVAAGSPRVLPAPPRLSMRPAARGPTGLQPEQPLALRYTLCEVADLGRADRRIVDPDLPGHALRRIRRDRDASHDAETAGVLEKLAEKLKVLQGIGRCLVGEHSAQDGARVVVNQRLIHPFAERGGVVCAQALESFTRQQILSTISGGPLASM